MFAKNITRFSLVFVTLTSLFFTSLGITPAYAAGITVNTDVDELTTNGECSLREAINNANNETATYPDCASGAGTDTITFAGNYTITLDGAQLPAVTSEILINGNGAANTIIQASDCNPVTLPEGCTPATYRIFEVTSTGNLALDSLTLRHGHCACGQNPDYGYGGGIFNDGGSLTIINSIITGNSATPNSNGSYGYGGGIWSVGNLTVINSTISENSAARAGGGIYSYYDSTLIVTNSTISGNSAAYAGGIYYSSGLGTFTITNSTIQGNTANTVGGDGGGIWNQGSLTIINSTISGNSAYARGGGIFNYTTLTLTNSTLYGNIATFGGGIYNGGGGIYNFGTLTVANSTLYGNNAPWGSGIAQFGNTLNYFNTIIASESQNPSGEDCYHSTGVIGTNINNLVEDGTCSASLSGDPLLGTLADNGGPTQTMSLLPGSPAIDAGDDTVCEDVNTVNNLDQRGVTRPQGPHCDIGAFELEAGSDTGAPTDIQLSASTLSENLPAGTTVGTLTTVDPDSGDTHTYSFCGGAGDASFALAGNALNTAAMFDYEAQNTFDICIRSTDSGGLFTDKTFQILVQDVPENPAPSNDDFANATIITSLPFSDIVDSSLADTEAGEPIGVCGTSSVTQSTVWYRFTSPTTTVIELTLLTDFPYVQGIYRGNSLDSLTTVVKRCSVEPADGFPYELVAEANTTYYIQIGARDTSGGTAHLSAEVASPPQAAFSFSPSDPSTFDTIQFTDTTPPWSFGGSEVRAFTWDFGDGTTSTLEDPTHRYLTDGDYTVQHTTTTFGFTTSTSQVVQVRTHDVAITKIVAPTSGNVNQSRPITVYIKNNRYAETVLIKLYKSNPNVAGGFELVGSYTQFVPVRSGNRTSAFTFNYTFTAADLAVGKVTFKAVATLVSGHDAIPSDNELSSSPPTLVRR